MVFRSRIIQLSPEQRATRILDFMRPWNRDHDRSGQSSWPHRPTTSRFIRAKQGGPDHTRSSRLGFTADDRIQFYTIGDKGTAVAQAMPEASMSRTCLSPEPIICLPLEHEGTSSEGQTVVVPSVWALEVANAVLVAERRKRIGKADIVRFATLWGNLSISEMSVPVGGILETVIPLAREHGLSAYDAAYLDVAVRTGLALATADGPLEHAARKAGVVMWAARKGSKGKRRRSPN